MSNSQPCHGQRRISPGRVYRIVPGSEDSASPISGPSHKAAPGCGQRFSRPKNSPLMLNTAIGRSSMVRNIRVPGGSSSTGPMTCLAILFSTHELYRKTGSHFSGSCEPVQLPRVAQIKCFAVGVADACGEHARGIVIIPMRVIGREQQLVPADPPDQFKQMLAPL